VQTKEKQGGKKKKNDTKSINNKEHRRGETKEQWKWKRNRKNGRGGEAVGAQEGIISGRRSYRRMELGVKETAISL